MRYLRDSQRLRARHEYRVLLGAAVQAGELDRRLVPVRVGDRRERAHTALDARRVDDVEAVERREVAPLVGICRTAPARHRHDQPRDRHHDHHDEQPEHDGARRAERPPSRAAARSHEERERLPGVQGLRTGRGHGIQAIARRGRRLSASAKRGRRLATSSSTDSSPRTGRARAASARRRRCSRARRPGRRRPRRRRRSRGCSGRRRRARACGRWWPDRGRPRRRRRRGARESSPEPRHHASVSSASPAVVTQPVADARGERERPWSVGRDEQRHPRIAAPARRPCGRRRRVPLAGERDARGPRRRSMTVARCSSRTQEQVERLGELGEAVEALARRTARPGPARRRRSRCRPSRRRGCIRPPEIWSTVAMSFANGTGCRKLGDATKVPSRMRSSRSPRR